MEFIDLFSALQTMAACIESEWDPDLTEPFVAAGKISQSSANELRDRLDPGIDSAKRVSAAARRFNEALHDSGSPKPKLFEYDHKRALASPAGRDAWSKMVSLLLQAMFWGIREQRYCLEHFCKATTKGEYFMRSPIDRHETDDWLAPNGYVPGLTLLGFDSDELFSFLDVNGIIYKRQQRQKYPRRGDKTCMKNLPA